MRVDLPTGWHAPLSVLPAWPDPLAFCILTGSWFLFSSAAFLLDIEKDIHTYTTLLGSQPASEGQPVL